MPFGLAAARRLVSILEHCLGDNDGVVSVGFCGSSPQEIELVDVEVDGFSGCSVEYEDIVGREVEQFREGDVCGSEFCGDGDVRHCGAPRPEADCQVDTEGSGLPRVTQALGQKMMQGSNATHTYNLSITHPGITAMDFAQSVQSSLRMKAIDAWMESLG